MWEGKLSRFWTTNSKGNGWTAVQLDMSSSVLLDCNLMIDKNCNLSWNLLGKFIMNWE